MLLRLTGHEGRVVGRFDPSDRLDGGGVLGNLDRLLGGQIPALDLLVAAGHEHLGAVVVPATVQDGALKKTEPFYSPRSQVFQNI